MSNPTPQPHRTVWHITTDLMMASTVQLAARDNGWIYRQVPPPAAATTEVAADVAAVVVDLQTLANHSAEIQARLEERRRVGELSVLLYAQHVNTEALEHGRTWGAAEVWTRGKFHRGIADWLRARGT